METDFTVRDEGTIVLLTAETEAAKLWVNNNLPEDKMIFGKRSVVIEHRYASDILTGIQNDGLTVEVS